MFFIFLFFFVECLQSLFASVAKIQGKNVASGHKAMKFDM